MDHIAANNIVTLKSLETNRTPEVIGSVIGRLEDVYNMSSEYLTKGMLILDIGTKDGLFFDVLVEKGLDKDYFVGIDCCPEVVKICNEKGYDTLLGDIQGLDTDDNSVDFIFIVHTLEHVPNPELAIKNCTSMLKDGGFIFVEVPIQSQIDAPEKWGHYHPFTSQQQVKDLFGGYKVLKEDWQKTKSKSPWYRVLFQKGNNG